jgi:hypothetical protein
MVKQDTMIPPHEVEVIYIFLVELHALLLNVLLSVNHHSIASETVL